MKEKNLAYLTSSEMLTKALKQLELFQGSLVTFNTLRGNEKLLAQQENISTFILIVENLKYAMLLGKGEACFYLAQFHYKGWGFNQNKDKGDFLIYIGKELGDDRCLKAKLENENIAVKFGKEIFQCSQAILNNKNTYYNKKITYEIKKRCYSFL